MSFDELYGKGIGFPPRVAADGGMVWSSGELNVRESICIILRTQPGERVLVPEFGCGLNRFLFEPSTISTLRQIQDEVKRALSRWEPRIRLDDIRVETSPTDARIVHITVQYSLIATGQREQVSLTLSTQG